MGLSPHRPEPLEKPDLVEPDGSGPVEHRAVAAPLPLLRRAAQPRLHGIPRDVPRRRPHLLVAHHRLGPEPSLEHMPDLPVPAVEQPRIGAVQPLHPRPDSAPASEAADGDGSPSGSTRRTATPSASPPPQATRDTACSPRRPSRSAGGRSPGPDVMNPVCNFYTRLSWHDLPRPCRPHFSPHHPQRGQTPQQFKRQHRAKNDVEGSDP